MEIDLGRIVVNILRFSYRFLICVAIAYICTLCYMMWHLHILPKENVIYTLSVYSVLSLIKRIIVSLIIEHGEHVMEGLE